MARPGGLVAGEEREAYLLSAEVGSHTRPHVTSAISTPHTADGVVLLYHEDILGENLLTILSEGLDGST